MDTMSTLSVKYLGEVDCDLNFSFDRIRMFAGGSNTLA